MKEGKILRRMEKLERHSRGKYVDSRYESSPKICLFYSSSKCSHCIGDHYGLPFQRNKVKDENGILKEVPCLLQEQFQWSYGEETMVEMIKEGGVKCMYPIAYINGMWLACSGNHPTHIHKEVVDRLKNKGEGIMDSWDMIKRCYMSELPVRD